MSPRPLSPVPISDADLADELKPPGVVASLGRSRPGVAWFALAFVAVAAAFVGGVALGRHSAPKLAAVPLHEASPPPKPAEVAPTPSPESATPPAVASATGESAAASSASAPEPKATAAAKADGPAFNTKAAATNLAIAAARAHGCHMRGDPAGVVSAEVTFATNGRVSDVSIAAPHTGTKTALCITYKLNTVRVPPYGGSVQTVKQPVQLK
ncbi:MAG TPA: hypothetical protein VNN72_27765 [Polyangiaceae bacterium]|nr:hypothetical protein [Polyangiaceae bacterium]